MRNLTDDDLNAIERRFDVRFEPLSARIDAVEARFGATEKMLGDLVATNAAQLARMEERAAESFRAINGLDVVLRGKDGMSGVIGVVAKLSARAEDREKNNETLRNPLLVGLALSALSALLGAAIALAIHG
ncbi:MAG: hypothetical protein ACYDCK_01520 [Thermoplasmatota archaeon]